MQGGPPGAAAIAALLALGLCVTAGGTWAYFRLARRAGPSFLSLFNYLNPLVAVGCGWLFLGEALSAGLGPALALIVAGLFFTS
jgi:drug/metabolite transporter (DMT)-like permease